MILNFFLFLEGEFWRQIEMEILRVIFTHVGEGLV